MFHELATTGRRIDTHDRTTPDLIDAVLSSNACVSLHELGNRDRGFIAPVSAIEIERYELPGDTTAVVVWTLFDVLDDEAASETVVMTLTAGQQAEVLDNVMSVAVDALVRHADKHGIDPGHPAARIVAIRKRETTADTPVLSPGTHDGARPPSEARSAH